MNERVLHTGYSLRAVVLVTHETTCAKCKRSYRSPQGLMLQLSSKEGSIFVSPKVAAWDLDLPRMKQTVSISVDACEECFKETSGKKDLGEYTLLDRRIGNKNELFIRPRRVEDIELRLAGDAINKQHPGQRHKARKKEDPKPEQKLSEMF